MIATARIVTERLALDPLVAHDADEMIRVLDDVRLHAFVGGRPLALAELRNRYARLFAGAPDSAEIWHNWVVRKRADGAAVGTVQATITVETDPHARVAWVIGVPWQRRGIATEAARALVEWLIANGIERVEACVHPDNLASVRVAQAVGMQPTDQQVDGEIVWARAR